MARERKYTRPGDKAVAYECTKCKWQGTDDDKAHKPLNWYSYQLVCPKCRNNDFYGLLKFKAVC